MASIVRRSVLKTVITGATVTLTGCSTVIPGSGTQRVEEPKSGIDIQNCLQRDVDARVIVQRVASNEETHNESHTIPEGYCSDFGEVVSITDVFDAEGEYNVKIEAALMEPEETRVSVTEKNLKGKPALDVYVHIDEDGITID